MRTPLANRQDVVALKEQGMGMEEAVKTARRTKSLELLEKEDLTMEELKNIVRLIIERQI